MDNFQKRLETAINKSKHFGFNVNFFGDKYSFSIDELPSNIGRNGKYIRLKPFQVEISTKGGYNDETELFILEYELEFFTSRHQNPLSNH